MLSLAFSCLHGACSPSVSSGTDTTIHTCMVSPLNFACESPVLTKQTKRSTLWSRLSQMLHPSCGTVFPFLLENAVLSSSSCIYMRAGPYILRRNWLWWYWSLLWLGCYFNKGDTGLKLFTVSWNLWGYGSWLQVVGAAAELVPKRTVE